MRISDWSSDVCSSDLVPGKALALLLWLPLLWPSRGLPGQGEAELVVLDVGQGLSVLVRTARHGLLYDMGPAQPDGFDAGERRSEEHTSELQSLMRISYAVFCLKKKNTKMKLPKQDITTTNNNNIR